MRDRRSTRIPRGWNLGQLASLATTLIRLVAAGTFSATGTLLLATGTFLATGTLLAAGVSWAAGAEESIVSAVPMEAASTPPQFRDPAADTRSLIELKAAAYDAQQTAQEAESAAVEAKAAAEAARKAVGQVAVGAAVAVPVAAAGASAAPSAPPPPPVEPAVVPAAASEVPDPTLEAIHRATEEAKTAAAAARAATAALEEHLREREARYSRNGLYLSGGVFWAPELFDTSLSAQDSRGAFGAIGYHFAERFEIEARFDAIDEFRLSGRGLTGKLDGWSATLNGRVFILTGVFQPYIGMGIGVLQGTTSYREVSTGHTVRYRDTVALLRVSAGFDLYVSEHIALTADASVNMPSGELTAANYATLGGGLKFRF